MIQKKLIDLFWGRGESGQVEVKTADEGAAVGFGRGAETAFRQICENEFINGIARPMSEIILGRSRFGHWGKGPMTLPFCALKDPLP